MDNFNNLFRYLYHGTILFILSIGGVKIWKKLHLQVDVSGVW